MRWLAVRFLSAVLALAGTAAAADLKTPYAAEVVADNVSVRSGNGSRFYVTGTLRRGDRVRVHRHDPGGWYMIAPPPGSFSWIRADYVRREGHTGVLVEDQVVVRVGSQLGDDHDVEQVRLSSGDRVEILGEKTLMLGPGPTRMYQITPPQGEYRWIEGKYVIPADPIARRQHDRDPFKVPSTAQRAATATTTVTRPPQDQLAEGPSDRLGDWQTPVEVGPVLDRPVTRTDGDAVRRSAPDDAVLEADRETLRKIDDGFRDMIKHDPREWDLDALEADYRALQERVTHPALLSQLELRFPAIERYRRVKTEYDDLIRLTSETSRRDAELASMQQEALKVSTDTPTPATPPTPAAPPATQSQGPTLQSPVPTPTQPPPTEVPKLDGAGIVQRAPVVYGPIRHVLVAPDGHILAFLQAAKGVNLDLYLGQEMGLYGQRTRREDLRADFIYVNRLIPVRLAR